MTNFNERLDEIANDEEALKLELGDVLWYLSAVSFYLGVSLEEVAKSNLEKLNSRKTRGKIHEQHGFGFPVCEKCYEKELERYEKN